MSEQIIIDGVDVSECRLYLYRDKQPKNSRSCGEGLVDCNGKDCLFKQLQRMKADRDNVLNDYIKIKGENIKLQEDLTALQQTYEACEKEYKALNEKYIKVLELSKKGVDAYEYCIQELEQENEKLRAK